MEFIDFEDNLVRLLLLMELEIGDQHDSHEFLFILQEYIQAISDQVQNKVEILPILCNNKLQK
jgi:hypothetical protein